LNADFNRFAHQLGRPCASKTIEVFENQASQFPFTTKVGAIFASLCKLLRKMGNPAACLSRRQ
jgi:hypothetical protein